MDFWTAVVIIVAIGCFTFVRLRRHDRPDLSGKRAGVKSAHEMELEHEVEKLRERIAVLERIATDDRRGADLAAEIESLRG